MAYGIQCGPLSALCWGYGVSGAFISGSRRFQGFRRRFPFWPGLRFWLRSEPISPVPLPAVRRCQRSMRRCTSGRPEILRLISNFRRAALKAFAILGWLAIVPVPDNVRLASTPNVYFVGSMERLTRGLIVIVLVLTLVLALGWFPSLGASGSCLWKRFEEIAPDRIREELRATAGTQEDELRITRNGALIMQFLVKMGTGHWGDAGRCAGRDDLR